MQLSSIFVGGDDVISIKRNLIKLVRMPNNLERCQTRIKSVHFFKMCWIKIRMLSLLETVLNAIFFLLLTIISTL
jgi:hypothetical protein